jgi:GNAT superfamily N-acetyltransferase
LAVIRLARADDLPHLREIERAAGSGFIDLDMSAVADHDPPPLEVLSGYQRDGRAWVAVDEADHPVAYLLIDVVDAAAHVEQVSVHPSHAGHRLGSALIDTAARWAAQHHLESLTLTTFAEVPWNAPYYARLGFHVLAEQELTDGLRRIREHEAAVGLDRWRRVAMARPVAPRPELDGVSPSQ